MPSMQNEITDAPAPRPFRICEQCRKLTPSELPQCVNCGAFSVHSVVVDEQERAERKFAQAYFSRATPVTYVILGLNIVVFLLMMLVGSHDDPALIIAFGAKTNELLRQGEWFRLVTPIFIHASLLHIASNSYALWIVGPQVERLYGSARFLLIYLLSGIGGVLGSYLGQEVLRKPSVPSVGASGAIFGLFGVLAVFGVRYRNELPQTFRSAFGKSVFPVIAINLFIGFSIPFIDNSAHIGGLVTGALLTFLIPYLAPGQERTTKLGLVMLLLSVMVVAACFVQAYRKSGEHLIWRQSALSGYLAGVNAASAAINQAFVAMSSAQMDKSSVVIQLNDASEILGKAKAPDQQSERIRLELLSLLDQQRKLLASPASSPSQVKAALAQSEQVQKQISEWVRNEGAQHGLSVDSSKEDSRK